MAEDTLPARATANGVARLAVNDPIALGEVLAQSGYFKDATGAAQAAVKVMAGQELGFGPVASMTGVHIIEGKPSVGANLLAALVKRSPKYRYRVVEHTTQRCVIQFFERTDDGWEELAPPSEFAIEDAKRAGVASRKNWQQYPKNMLFARCMSNGVTFHCPDLTGGAPIYTPEELGVEVNGETGEILSAPLLPPAPNVPAERLTAKQARQLEEALGAYVDQELDQTRLDMKLTQLGIDHDGDLGTLPGALGREQGRGLFEWLTRESEGAQA